MTVFEKTNIIMGQLNYNFTNIIIPRFLHHTCCLHNYVCIPISQFWEHSNAQLNLHVLADLKLKPFFPTNPVNALQGKICLLCVFPFMCRYFWTPTLWKLYTLKTIVIMFSTIIIIFSLVLANSVLARIPAASKFALECLLAAGIISTARLRQYF